MTSVSTETISLQLARFVAALKYEHLPIDVINHTKSLLVEQLAVGLIGSTLEWYSIVLETTRAQHGRTSSLQM